MKLSLAKTVFTLQAGCLIMEVLFLFNLVQSNITAMKYTEVTIHENTKSTMYSEHTVCLLSTLMISGKVTQTTNE